MDKLNICAVTLPAISRNPSILSDSTSPRNSTVKWMFSGLTHRPPCSLAAAFPAIRFSAACTASEGTEEGGLIGNFVRHMFDRTPERDLFVFVAEDAGEIVGSVIFSRLIYDQDNRTVFVLSPLAVATDHQGKGIGQRLLKYGFKSLEAAHVDVVLTYGDPGFYSKVGFSQITEAFAAAPFALTRPEGWLALSLTDTELASLKGAPRCVEALSNPALW